MIYKESEPIAENLYSMSFREPYRRKKKDSSSIKRPYFDKKEMNVSGYINIVVVKNRSIESGRRKGKWI